MSHDPLSNNSRQTLSLDVFQLPSCHGEVRVLLLRFVVYAGTAVAISDLGHICIRMTIYFLLFLHTYICIYVRRSNHPYLKQNILTDLLLGTLNRT